MNEGLELHDAHLTAIAAARGLHEERMTSISRSGFRERHPDHCPAFNAHLADDSGQSRWQGDLDLTTDEPALVATARDFGKRLHVLREVEVGSVLPDQRRVDLAAISNAPDGTVELGSESLVPIARGDDGRLRPGPRLDD